jgi:hypothetical protein
MNIAEIPWTIETDRGLLKLKYAAVGPTSTSDVSVSASIGPV